MDWTTDLSAQRRLCPAERLLQTSSFLSIIHLAVARYSDGIIPLTDGGMVSSASGLSGYVRSAGDGRLRARRHLLFPTIFHSDVNLRAIVSAIDRDPIIHSAISQ